MSEPTFLKSFGARYEAEFAKNILEGEGIECMMTGEDAGGMRPELGFAQGGLKLFVKPEDLERAREILEMPPSSDPRPAEEDSSEKSTGFLTKLRRWLQE